VPVRNDHYVAGAHPFFKVFSVVLVDLLNDKKIMITGCILTEFSRTSLCDDSIDTTLHIFGTLTPWTPARRIKQYVGRSRGEQTRLSRYPIYYSFP